MSREQPKYKHLKEEEFKKLRLLVDASLTNKMIELATTRNKATVNIVRKCATFVDYLAYRKAEYDKRRGPKPSQLDLVKQSPTEIINMAASTQVLVNMLDQLILLNENIEYLIKSQQVIKSKYVEKRDDQ